MICCDTRLLIIYNIHNIYKAQFTSRHILSQCCLSQLHSYDVITPRLGKVGTLSRLTCTWLLFESKNHFNPTREADLLASSIQCTTIIMYHTDMNHEIGCTIVSRCHSYSHVYHRSIARRARRPNMIVSGFSLPVD